MCLTFYEYFLSYSLAVGLSDESIFFTEFEENIETFIRYQQWLMIIILGAADLIAIEHKLILEFNNEETVKDFANVKAKTLLH